jgi:hypothetical protein
MAGNQKEDVLPQLLEEIERAWNARGDHEVVHRLAQEHPELIEDLYEFFADLMDSRTDLGRERSEYADLDRRVKDYLGREGHERAAAARQAVAAAVTRTDSTAAGTPPPSERIAVSPARTLAGRTFLGALREVTGEAVDTLASAMGITADFLVTVSDHGRVIPIRARQELVKRARGAGRAPNESELLASFDVQPPAMKRAASRESAFGQNAPDYETLVRLSGLADAEKSFWLRLA